MRRKKIVILGSTGSIGINALKVAERFSKEFEVVGLSAYRNTKLLEKQIKKFRPKYVAAQKEEIVLLQKRIRSRHIRFLDVEIDIKKMVSAKEVDIVLLGIGGSAALKSFLLAVRQGKTVAPANKEALVMAGNILMREAKKHHAKIIPVDSEQSAIFQCLEGQKKKKLKKVYLTASGGSLRDVSKNRFDKLSVKEILNHPRWKMGKKITVDSATLMNKGLEVIEAMWLFGLKAQQIEVIIHPESIVHSMVEFADGALIAQLGVTDMRIPIQYALTYPERRATGLADMNFVKQGKLTFRAPDHKKFPSIKLCYEAAKKGGTFPSVLNAANEEAVEAFLKGKIRFSEIYTTVFNVVKKHKALKPLNLKSILKADVWARSQAKSMIER